MNKKLTAVAVSLIVFASSMAGAIESDYRTFACWPHDRFFGSNHCNQNTTTAKVEVKETAPATVAKANVETEKNVLSPDPIFYDVNKVIPGAEGKQELDTLANWMKENSNSKIFVDSYADRTGSLNHNISLSKRRAAETRAYLLKKGVAANRIQTNLKGNLPGDERKTVVKIVK